MKASIVAAVERMYNSTSPKYQTYVIEQFLFENLSYKDIHKSNIAYKSGWSLDECVIMILLSEKVSKLEILKMSLEEAMTYIYLFCV